MGLIITTPKLTVGIATYGVFLRKRSDGFIWRPGTGWVASCTNAQAFVALTELAAQFAGVYAADVTGLEDAGWVDAVVIDSGDTYSQVSGTGIGAAYVLDGVEVHPLSDAELTAAHGSGAWTSDGGVVGPGADPVTILIGTSGSPVPDADVWITSDEEGENVVAGTSQTNSSGEVVFYLDYGSVYYLWAQKDGKNTIRGQEFTASAD
jgi:hypothetical protein